MRTLYTPGRAFALALLVAAVSLLPAPAPAQAHLAADWFSQARWPVETVHDFAFQTSFPTGDFRTASMAGVDEWNTNSNPWTPEFQATLPDSSFTQWTNPCTNSHSAVFWENEGNSGNLGQAVICADSADPFGPVIRQFSVRINSFYTYYPGTGTPPSSEFDLTSLMAHEFGHVVGGWLPSHWDQGLNPEPDLCLSDPDKHTMCSTLNSGVTWQRELREHEIHTFHDAYREPIPPCEVEYRITSTWPGNVQAELVVHNNTPSFFNSGNNWQAQWTYTGNESVYNSWGTTVTQVGPAATAVGNGFGSMVPPGGSVAVGIQATVTGTPTVPSPITCTVVN
jgi:Cellulose binding domain